jgi:hypothetical protein
MIGLRRRGAAAAVVALFALASCGGGSSGSDIVDDTSETDGTEQTDGGGDSGDTDLGDIGDDCTRAAAAFTKALESFEAFNDLANGGEFSVDVDALRSDIESARGAVPSEVRGAYDTYMGAFLVYAEALNGVNPEDYTDPDVLERITTAAAAFGTAEVVEATTVLTEYFTQECGLNGLAD